MAKQRYIVTIRDNVKTPQYKSFTVQQTNLSQDDIEHVANAVARYVPGVVAMRILSSHCEAIALVARDGAVVNWQDVVHNVSGAVHDCDGSLIKVKNADKLPVPLRPGNLGYSMLSIKPVAA